ncbi:MAG TPA: class I SAM-dependent methyltransferase [Terriglobales bacterium]
MKWIAHQIRTASSATMNHQEGHSQRVLRHVQLAKDLFQKPFDKMRVLDLACLEGGFSFELAMQGADTLGLEGRLENVDKCEAVKNQIGLSNCQFLQGDVRKLSQRAYGVFDVVLCLGILYHLTAEDAVRLLHQIYEVCGRVAIIDTHVGLFGEEHVDVGGQAYFGRSYREFPSGTPSDDKVKALRSSLDNETSFWMTEESLTRCLQQIGFTSVMKVLLPPIPLNVGDRVTFVAIKGEPVQLRSCDMPESLEIRERTNPSVLRASFTDKELFCLYRKRNAADEMQELARLQACVSEEERRNRELTNQLSSTKATLNSVLNSKGWRFLEVYRSARNSFRRLWGS